MKEPAVGIDLIEIKRIQEAIHRWGERFIRRIYTTAEITAYRNKIESLAVRFAAKEAVMKVLDAEEGWISWKDIEVLTENSGKPRVILSGGAAHQARLKGLTGFAVSLSHTRENAVAIVIGITED